MKSRSIVRASGYFLLLAPPRSCSGSTHILQAPTHLSPKDLVCPADCGDMFKHLDRDGIQKVEVQIRGEPKSGTGTSEEWAAAALHATCDYLKGLYGENSCWMNREEKFDAEMVFHPRSVSASSETCPCSNVHRVSIRVFGHGKHVLPVDIDGCQYRHPGEFATSREGMCIHRDGRPPDNQVDLWKCVEEARCTPNDSRLQLVVMRDPRAVTVSAYFHLRRIFHIPSDVTVDHYFQENLELMCQWISLRYFLFTQMLGDQSELFWYGDHELDPFDWHRRYLGFVGLNLPLDETMAMARAASRNEIAGTLAYKMKGIDRHDGRKDLNSTFRDELGEDSIQMMDDMLRRWLPPVVLRRLGVRLVCDAT